MVLGRRRGWLCHRKSIEASLLPTTSLSVSVFEKKCPERSAALGLHLGGMSSQQERELATYLANNTFLYERETMRQYSARSSKKRREVWCCKLVGREEQMIIYLDSRLNVSRLTPAR